MNKTIRNATLIGAAVVTLAYTGYMLTGFKFNATAKAQFDSTAWQQHYQDKGSENNRYQMVDDLLKQVKVGVSLDQLKSLLGEPDFTNDVGMHYYTGECCSGTNISEVIVNINKVNSTISGIRFEQHSFDLPF